MNWSSWRTHFEANARRPLPAVEALELPSPQRQALVHSLARFQLGESGEGRIAHEIDAAALPGIDHDYRAALKRFVAEEGRHARILATVVLALGGTLLQRQWTQRLFVRGRRLLGVRFKLLVLLAAEVIGIAFYGLLARALPGSAIGRALAQICADEEAHLQFHGDFFRAQAPSPGVHRLLCCAWWVLGPLAALVVLIDHRRTLEVFQVPLRTAARTMLERIAEASHRMRRWPVGASLLRGR